MHLLRPPRRPPPGTSVRIKLTLNFAPESWRDFLYWNSELDES
jgi:hypothetical protein